MRPNVTSRHTRICSLLRRSSWLRSRSASFIGECRLARTIAKVGAPCPTPESTADYGTVADKYAGTKVAPWARLREGEAELSSGIRLLFTNRDAGRSDLKKAEENLGKTHRRQKRTAGSRRTGALRTGALPGIAAGKKGGHFDDQRSGHRDLRAFAERISGHGLQATCRIADRRLAHRLGPGFQRLV